MLIYHLTLLIIECALDLRLKILKVASFFDYLVLNLFKSNEIFREQKLQRNNKTEYMAEP